MGMETEPKLMFNNNSNANDKVKRENRRIFRFLFCKFGFVCVVVCSGVLLKNAIAFLIKCVENSTVIGFSIQFSTLKLSH